MSKHKNVNIKALGAEINAMKGTEKNKSELTHHGLTTIRTETSH